MSIQLAVGCKLLQNPSHLHQLLQELSIINKPIIIKQQICQCESHLLSYAKLSMVIAKNSIANSVYSIKIWSQQDNPSRILLNSQHFNAIVCQNYNASIDVGDSKSTIIVSSMHQLRDLLRLSVFQLDRRCKLEFKLRKSHQIYEVQHKKEKLREMALAYFQQKCIKQTKNLLNFMRFNTTAYLKITRRCFTLWLIHKYEQGLCRINDQLIKTSKNKQRQKIVLKKCFSGWKSLLQRQV